MSFLSIPVLELHAGNWQIHTQGYISSTGRIPSQHESSFPLILVGGFKICVERTGGQWQALKVEFVGLESGEKNML